MHKRVCVFACLLMSWMKTWTKFKTVDNHETLGVSRAALPPEPHQGFALNLVGPNTCLRLTNTGSQVMILYEEWFKTCTFYLHLLAHINTLVIMQKKLYSGVKGNKNQNTRLFYVQNLSYTHICKFYNSTSSLNQSILAGRRWGLTTCISVMSNRQFRLKCGRK